MKNKEKFILYDNYNEFEDYLKSHEKEKALKMLSKLVPEWKMTEDFKYD